MLKTAKKWHNTIQYVKTFSYFCSEVSLQTFFYGQKTQQRPDFLHLKSWERVENALDEIADIRRLVEPSDEQNVRYRYLLHRIAVDVFLMEHIFDKGT